ncbi:MAG: hypothetical protein SOR87_08160 [Vescimonas coprocola]|nr:hypothetical protein [Vescimonas coprocola]
MNWKETFYTGKREHPQEEKPASLTALLMPSLLGTVICLACLCSLTWAWFTATQNSGVQPIQSATATVTASLNGTVLGELPIEEGMTGTGTLTLHMDGSAQYAYVLIKVGGTKCRTGYLSANKDYTITVNESGAALTLCWGKQDDQSGTAVVENGGSIGTAQPSNTTDEQPAVNGDSQQTPDTTVPANGDANTGDQTSNGENTGSENGGSTGNGSGEQGSDSGTGSDTGAGASTGGDAGTGDTSNGTDGTTGE